MNVAQVQTKLNEMLEADMHKRRELVDRGELFNGYHPEMEDIHVGNSKMLDQIIREFGYPTSSRVGQDAALAAWTILMHSISNPPLMKKVLELLSSPLYKDEVDPKEIAYLADRVRVFEGKPQIYGTQFDWDENKELSPYPIENSEMVNERRRKIGLLPIEEQTEIMRERARKEGDRPPDNDQQRENGREAWARKVGWMT